MPATARLARRSAAALAPLLLLAAATGPGAHAAAPPFKAKVPSSTAAEGSVAQIAIPLRCPPGRSRCVFLARVAGGTGAGAAQSGVDFAGLDRSRLVLKAGRSQTLRLSERIVQDSVCEPAETVSIAVTTTLGGRSRTDVGGITILDDDCRTPAPTTAPTTTTTTTAPTPTTTTPAPTPTPAKPTPVTFPADSGTPTITNMPTSTGAMQTCRTPAWIGQDGQAGANSFFNSGCSVKLTCPTSAATCTASAESGISLERGVDDTVTLNSRIRVASASGSEFFHRDQSCSGTNFCRTEDQIMLRGGETATNQCNGVRVAPTQPNRSVVTCSIVVERAS